MLSCQRVTSALLRGCYAATIRILETVRHWCRSVPSLVPKCPHQRSEVSQCRSVLGPKCLTSFKPVLAETCQPWANHSFFHKIFSPCHTSTASLMLTPSLILKSILTMTLTLTLLPNLHCAIFTLSIFCRNRNFRNSAFRTIPQPRLRRSVNGTFIHS